MSVIDSHQHFWQYSPDEYGWIDDSMQTLRRDFLPSDLEAEMSASGVDGCIAVQARQTMEETEWLLSLARQSPSIRGVVGWVPLATPDCASALEGVRHPLLKGVRHIAQGEPDGFLLGDAFNQGVRLLKPLGLVYDVLVYARQLPDAIAFVDMHPGQVFVLDHIAKPNIRIGAIGPWAKEIRELARRQNVFCKLSGMVTEAEWDKWTADSLAPYFETVLETFGPARLMAGSDWPVCTVAASYRQWWQTVRAWLSRLSQEEQDQILGGTAIRAYSLG